jgi:hypothetical protein
MTPTLIACVLVICLFGGHIDSPENKPHINRKSEHDKPVKGYYE